MKNTFPLREWIKPSRSSDSCALNRNDAHTLVRRKATNSMAASRPLRLGLVSIPRSSKWPRSHSGAVERLIEAFLRLS